MTRPGDYGLASHIWKTTNSGKPVDLDGDRPGWLWRLIIVVAGLTVAVLATLAAIERVAPP